MIRDAAEAGVTPEVNQNQTSYKMALPYKSVSLLGESKVGMGERTPTLLLKGPHGIGELNLGLLHTMHTL